MIKKNNNYQLMDEVDQILFTKRNGPKNYESKPGIKPSDLSSPCIRQGLYNYLKLPSDFPFPIENIKDKDAGDAFHSMVRKWLRESGLMIVNLTKEGKVPVSFIDQETPDPEFPIYAMDLGIRYAKVDGLILLPPWHPKEGLWVLEVKSKKQGKFDRVKSPEFDRIQGQMYVFLLEEELRKGNFQHIPQLQNQTEIRGVLFFYVERSSQYLTKEFWEEKDPEIFELGVKRCSSILDSAEQRILPEKTPHFCNWCRHREKCSREFNPFD